jgi:hypothetical protein
MEVPMSANANDVPKISDSERDAFRQALVLYYTQGPPIAAAFDRVEAGLVDRYYRRKKKYPDEIERIDREAQDAAQREMSGEQFAFESRQLIRSREIQHAAADALIEAIPALGAIARREPYEVVIGEGPNGQPKTKVLLTYARDAVQAFSILQSLARGGVLPETMARTGAASVQSAADEREPPPAPMLPLLGINPNFSKVTAITPDGTEFTAEVKRGEVVEGDVQGPS